MSFTERFFKLKENNTTAGREIYAGLLSFLAVAYILAVNPAILSSTGMDKGGIFYATALSAFAGTMIMAFLANYPLVLAPAMGLNAFFAYSVVNAMGYSWQFALFAIVVEGIVFLLLSSRFSFLSPSPYFFSFPRLHSPFLRRERFSTRIYPRQTTRRLPFSSRRAPSLPALLRRLRCPFLPL